MTKKNRMPIEIVQYFIKNTRGLENANLVTMHNYEGETVIASLKQIEILKSIGFVVKDD